MLTERDRDRDRETENFVVELSYNDKTIYSTRHPPCNCIVLPFSTKLRTRIQVFCKDPVPVFFSFFIFIIRIKIPIKYVAINRFFVSCNMFPLPERRARIHVFCLDPDPLYEKSRIRIRIQFQHLEPNSH